ncbi:SDR family oxidoreductase [Kribbella sandramycini]|uniref:SDR family oxidoreductase n=1 Tax=Kribbella sandramycini TaxID=60450 RepID=A0A7Y4P0J4_9ACTN|nr:SDR family oxidoreductase [Kribbella sandramycini]MBB6566619.1 uncharacterized protein YbjT (DUF2867 family) [Kribbella sandramycini]NOL42726.1 SDR family oxidoreductase [Kribbella sandramycini]
MKIVVLGGGWLLGSMVLRRLTDAGHQAVGASSNTGVNPLTGEGLDRVLEGASVVVDLTNSPSFEDTPQVELFRTAITNTLRAEQAAGVSHHVAFAVVGTERSPQVPHFRAKLAETELIKSSGIPYSLVHATQMYELLTPVAASFDLDGVLRVQPVDFQPVAADEVADHLAEVALGHPLNDRVDIAGPDRSRMDEFFRTALALRGDPREVVADPNARCYGTVLTQDALVPAGPAVLGKIRYANWSNN